LDRGILLGIGLVAVLLVVNAGLSYWNTRQLDENAGLVAQTEETLDLLDNVLQAVVDAETGERGYLLTRQDEFLDPYRSALPRLKSTLAQLKQRAAGNSRLADYVHKLEELTALRVALLQERIDLRSKGAPDAGALDAAWQGKTQMDRLRALIAEIAQQENRDLWKRKAQSAHAYRVAVATGLASALAGLGLLGAFTWVLARGLAARQQAADLIEEQREWLRVTLTSIGDAVIVTDAEGRVRFLNTVAQSLTGWPQDEADNQPLDKVFAIVNEHTRRPPESPVRRALAQGTVVALANHTVLVSRNGSERPIEDSAAPIRDGRGNFVGVVLIFRDVTERRHADEVRRRLAAIVESSDDAIVSKTLDGIITSWNVGAEQLYGYSAAEMLGKPFSLLVPADRPREAEDAVERLLRAERIYDFETVRRRKDGGLIDVSVSYSPVRNADGQLAGISVIARDITERRRAERAVRESEERLRLALEAGHMGVWDWNILTNDIRWSENLEPIHGLAPGTFAGTVEAFEALIHPDDRQLVRGAITRALECHSSYEAEFRNVWPDGTVRWMVGKGKVYCDEQGQPFRMVGVGMDVTDRKRAEQDARFLADASAALAGLVDYESTLQKVARLAVPNFADWCAVDMLDEGGTVRRLAIAHVDASKAELGLELHRRYPPDPDAPQGVWHIFRTGKSEIIPEITDALYGSVKDDELRRILRELGLRSYIGVPLALRKKVLGVLTFVAAESGRHYGPGDLMVAEDLAHRAAVAIENAHLYQALREADQRKDEFLALLGHELRNPLAPIRNSLQILKLAGTDAAPADRAREVMERQVEHMVRLVDDLLDVSRIMRGKVELRRQPTELTTVVARAVETAQPMIDAEGHQLAVSLPPEPLWVQGDLVRLAQVVSNLLNNAAKYTDRGGRIWLSARREGAEAVLRVRDTGIGIAPDALPRIFDMFFQAERRTRNAQGGLGIGLSLIRGLVELHGGRVEARSGGPGKGSEFLVRLPLQLLDGQPGERRKSQEPEAAMPLPPHRVLVVDDSTDAADSLAMLLRLQGQEVLVAYDGPSALEMAEASPPDIAFLDIGMPKMDGLEVARRFRAHPNLKRVQLVAVTGWGQPEDRQRTREVGFQHHLVKPVESAALRRLLAGARSTAAPPAQNRRENS
jgi:PAS domain S-box-containing protein